MRLGRQHEASTLGLNMTPMIDIVFLLIIFFMTISQITQNAASEIRLPEVAVADDFDIEFAIEIMLNRDGDLFMEGDPVAADSLDARLLQFATENSIGPSKLQIQLRIDRECDSRIVNDVFETLRSAGVQRVFSAVLKTPGPGETPN